MEGFETRLACLKERIRAAERAAGRNEGEVSLVAVSKTHGAVAIARAYRCGLRHFGENYLQEAAAKQDSLGHFDIGWHFIGPIQSNKTRLVAQRFAWVHGVERLKTAERLNAHRPDFFPRLNVCLQVNISGEASKSGVDPREVPTLLEAMAPLPRLRLRGLMAIPAPDDREAEQRGTFARMRELFDRVAPIYGMDTLSMGMSDDLEAAILEGSTQIRIGTALFGARPKPIAANNP
ncbi:MAG TPA: YggS family pyridoxal phosphate-dependent enzyme [Methylococcaceae bacterium]|nr:YggS family pyridoxal phosphate-dependent enzyme [Methylococcaceae bacterium]